MSYTTEQMIELATEFTYDLAKKVPIENFLIAGGFARDLQLGINPKDVDVVMKSTTTVIEPVGAFKRKSFRGTRLANFVTSPEGKDFMARWGLEIMAKQKYPFDFINQKETSSFEVYHSTKAPVELMVVHSAPGPFVEETFDFGICQCAYSADGKLFTSDAYENDVLNKELTLMIRDSITPFQVGWAIKNHLPRMKAKFPNHTFKIRAIGEEGDWDFDMLGLQERN